jgi:suppressor of fused protein SUFU
MDLAEYRRRYGGQDAAAPGWDAIDARLDEIYPGQKPKHWGTIFLNDPKLKPVDSPHGRVEFMQAFGITQAELDALKDTKHTAEAIVEQHRKTNPLLITDLSREGG